MPPIIRIGTRESQLAVWQAQLVKDLLEKHGHQAELVYIKSEGDIDLVTPLYEMGVQGVFTRSLDIALLANKIDLAVHSMKDVPTQLPKGLTQVCVLERGNYQDIFVLNQDWDQAPTHDYPVELPEWKETVTIGTSSIRRKAQWLHRYPNHQIENLRGNVNTRLKKVKESAWQGAIFAGAGLERINLRPGHSVNLHWMLPAPAQGAIMIVGRDNETYFSDACQPIHHEPTAICTAVERDFLRTLMGGCSTPISALATINNNNTLQFNGNIVSPNGTSIAATEMNFSLNDAAKAGELAAKAVLANGGQTIIDAMKQHV